MGGAAAVLARARRDMEGGEYRWVAEAVNHVVFADPANQEARDLLADCFEQLGYQAEAGTWRNIYLTGAQELRDGIRKVAAPTAVSPELLAALPIEMIFDYLGVMLEGPKAAGKTITINLDLTDTRRQYVLQVKNSVLNNFGRQAGQGRRPDPVPDQGRIRCLAHSPGALRRCAHSRKSEDRRQPAGAGRTGRTAGHLRLLVQHRGALEIVTDGRESALTLHLPEAGRRKRSARMSDRYERAA